MTAAPAVDDLRWRAVSAEHGIAALRHTHWLDADFRAYADAPGSWAAQDGRVIGRDLPVSAGAGGEVNLSPGQDIVVGSLRLRALGRDGSLALRVFDPLAPTRTSLVGIRSFPSNPGWVLEGVFVPAADGDTRVVRSVDGHEREEPATGVVAVEIGGEQVQLTVSRSGNGFHAVIADATGGQDAYRFRFLPIDGPDAAGRVTVDFNRAHLPPCAFSDQYVCPLPPPGNRLPVRIEAGERLPERDA